MTGNVAKNDKWIPQYFIMFFVGLAIVDGIFVWLATSTHTGVVTEHAYQKGLAYNDTVDAAESQEQLGWKGTIEYEAGKTTLTLIDSYGHFISDAEVQAHFFRPTQAGYDFSIPLPTEAEGKYGASVELPLKGQWDIRITAKWKQQYYQQHKRILVK